MQIRMTLIIAMPKEKESKQIYIRKMGRLIEAGKCKEISPSCLLVN